MKRPAWITIITVAVLTVVTYIHRIIFYIPAYRWLHRHEPFYGAESIDKVLGVIFCILTMKLMYRGSFRAIARELGLSAPVLPAVAFALVSSLPMLIGLALTHQFVPSAGLLPLLFLTVFGPIVEEIEYRGFGVRQLQRATRWSFWLVVWPSAVLFGLGHIDQGSSMKEMVTLWLMIGGAAVAFAWLVQRWQNLWVAVALHIFMNLWWELFSVARTAIGGWFPFLLQSLTILIAISITLIWTRPKASAAMSTS